MNQNEVRDRAAGDSSDTDDVAISGITNASIDADATADADTSAHTIGNTHAVPNVDASDKAGIDINADIDTKGKPTFGVDEPRYKLRPKSTPLNHSNAPDFPEPSVLRAANEDDDLYDPYSDYHDGTLRSLHFERDPWR